MKESEEKKLLKKIRDSADDLQIPESLKPGQIEKKLRMADTSRTKKKWWNSYVAAGTVSVAVIALVCVGGISLSRLGQGYEGESAADTRDEAEESMVSSAAQDSGPTVAEADPDDYKELYQYLQDAGLSQEESSDESWADSDGASEKVVEDAAASDAGADTAASSSTPAQDGQGYSDTNLRETDVDEGDIVKTDGEHIFATGRDGIVRIIQADSLKELAAITPENLEESVREIYITGNVLQIITAEDATWMEHAGSDVSYAVKNKEITHLYTYNIEDPQEPALLGERTQDGYYVTSRKNGKYLYLFTQFTPKAAGSGKDLESYVPKVDESFLPMDSIYLPEEKSLSPYLIVTSTDSENLEKAVDCLSIVAGSEQYYVSSESIYTANGVYHSGWGDVISYSNGTVSYGGAVSGGGQKTVITGFKYQDGRITGKGACSVKGYINDSFSMDEYQGSLRVLTTRWDEKTGEDSNGIYIFNEEMKMTGKLENLAPGETIQSARLLGDTGYFVTYRQTDPLFAVDLSDVKKPVVLGELKVTGFSEYLHFYGENRLLGIGWETDPDTQEWEGLKLSMFDISDPLNLKEIDRVVIPNVWSCSGLDNYKAFLADPKKNILGFACRGYTDADFRGEYTRYYVYSYDEKQGFTEKAAIELSTYDIEAMQEKAMMEENDILLPDVVRGLYIGSRFYLVTDRCIYSYDMEKEFQLTGSYSWE